MQKINRQLIDQSFMDWVRSGPSHNGNQRNHLRFGQYFVNKYFPNISNDLTQEIFYEENSSQVVSILYDHFC